MQPSFVRVGHRGAAALAPENTISSLAAALEQGVDMVEFDIIPAADGRIVLAHSAKEISPEAASLDDALAFIAREAPAHVSLDLDLKWHGFEDQVVAALRRHGLVDRAVASSFFAKSLRRLGGLEPGLRRGLSYPWDRSGLAERRSLRPLVWAGAASLRRALPRRIAGMIAGAGATSAMLHYSVLSAMAVQRCHEIGVTVFAWTIDERSLLERVLALGVDGVISNDPRIFAPDGERSLTDL